MSLSLISYFICLKASNQSDLMQHNVPAAIFHLAQYSVRQLSALSARRSVRRAVCGARRVFYACRFSLVLRHTEQSSVRVVAVHDNMHYARQHSMRSARLPHFGDMFQWRKSSVCCFGAHGAVNYTRAPSITLAPRLPPSFALATPTDGSIKFFLFFL